LVVEPPVNILRVRCRNLEEFEEHYRVDMPTGGVFCPTTTELSPGTAVVVEMACDGLPNKVLIRGRVTAWRPALPRMRIRAGATVAFDPEEGAKRDFMIETLRGVRPATRKRKHTRIPIGIPCRLRIAAGLDLVDAELREISVSGGLILGPVQPPIGTDVVLEITPPGSEAPFDLSGRVVYHAGENQTGVRFIYREGGGSRRLRELVRRFKTM
jgi:Tfp pilus assembly protein PilZ